MCKIYFHCKIWNMKLEATCKQTKECSQTYDDRHEVAKRSKGNNCALCSHIEVMGCLLPFSHESESGLLQIGIAFSKRRD